MGMGMLGAMAGLGTGTAQIGQEMMRQSYDQEKMAYLERKQNELLEKQEQMKIRGEERADARRLTPGTKEFDEAKRSQLEIENAEMRNTAAKDAVANQDVMTKGEGQYADGSFAVKGDDGRVRRLNADGTPKSGLLNSQGQLAGEAEDDFYKSTLSPKDKITLQREERAASDAALNRALQERKLDQNDRRIEAIIARGAGGSGSRIAFVETYDKIKKEKPDWTADQILTFMNQAKTPSESYSQQTEIDPLTNSVKTKTTVKGAGTPPGQQAAVEKRNGYDTKDGSVYKNGVRLGSAKTEAEARAMYKAAK